MSHQDRKRQGGNLNEYYTSERSQSEKVAFGMISTMWHSVKGKAKEMAKSLSEVGGEGSTNGWNTEFSGQWIYFMWLLLLLLGN